MSTFYYSTTQMFAYRIKQASWEFAQSVVIIILAMSVSPSVRPPMFPLGSARLSPVGFSRNVDSGI